LDGPEIDLNDAALALNSGFLDRQVRECLRLDRELVGKAVALACRRSSSAALSFEIGDVLKVMARTERRWAA
jgi:hypothetical protein